MIRNVFKLGAATVAGTVSYHSYVCYRDDDNSQYAITRIGRSVYTVGGIVRDYKNTFKNVESGDPDYKEINGGFHQRCADRLLRLCSDNGGCYIKVGQHVASLEYLLPAQYIDTLKVLHSNAPQSSLKSVKRVLRNELQQEPEDVFEEFAETPIGSASLAQVYKAKLKSGETVAVKVQHNDVYKNSFTDMIIMEGLGKLVDMVFPEFSLTWLINEMKINLPKELDFVNEADNAERVQKILAKYDWVRAPNVRRELSTKRVLVMDYEEGEFINDRQAIEANGVSTKTVLSRLGQLYSEMIFVSGFVHCDPHPGNILVNKKGDLILLDHGLYTQLTDEFRVQYANMWLAIIYRDMDGIERISEEMKVPSHLSKLLTSIVTGRTWTSVSEGNLSKSQDSDEAAMIKEYAANNADLINAVLASVPRQMLLIFKTNDLLRGIEAALGHRGSAKSFVAMTRCCLHANYETSLGKAGGLDWILLAIRKQLTMLNLSIYEWAFSIRMLLAGLMNRA